MIMNNMFDDVKKIAVSNRRSAPSLLLANIALGSESTERNKRE